MDFTIEQQTFSGPLGVLLDVLEKKELAITDVNLAHIADEYLQFMEKAEVPHDELADFLVIASRLIYMKSRELMPYLRIEEEEEGIPLEEQLRVYRIFAEAADSVHTLYMGSAVGFVPLFARWKKQKQVVEQQFLPARNITSESLAESFHAVIKKLEPFFALQEASIARVKSVEERMNELHDAIRTRASFAFKDVAKGARNKAEVVVSFLALLELVRQKVVIAKQHESSDIIIERV